MRCEHAGVVIAFCAREEAKACRNEWERQRLILIADQLEQLADIKELTSVRPDHAEN